MRLTRSGLYVCPAPVPKMPPGLVELMEGLTRDVLQHNPPDVYEFCARHMEQLLVIRDGHALTKKRLSVEQKIKRAQEKVRDRAEQRRRKYDEEMKYNQDVVKAEYGSPEEVKQNGSNSNQEENPVLEEKEKSTESILETKLKAPVHHEQDLAEALEVEIFHKHVGEAHNLNSVETKDSNEILHKETNEDEKSTEDVKHNDLLEELTDSKENKMFTLDVADANGLLEQMLINEASANDSYDHARIRRSVDPEENDQSKVETANETAVTKVSEEQNNAIENTDEFKAEVGDKTSTEAVISLITAVNNNNSEIQHEEENAKPVEVSVNNQNYTELKGNIIMKTADIELDRATTFANEVPETFLTPETIGDSNNDQVSKDDENSHVFEDKTEPSAELAKNNIEIESNNNDKGPYTTEENISQGEPLKEIVQDKVEVIDENLTSEEAPTTLVEIINENGNEVQLTANVSTNEVASEGTLHDNDNNSEKNDVINYQCATSNENDGITEKLDLTADINNETELKEDNTMIIIETTEDKPLLDHNSESNSNNSNKNGNENFDINLDKEILPITDDKIIETIEQLEVCTEPIGIHQDDTDESLNINEKLASENNVTAEVSNKEATTEEPAVEIDKVTERNGDSAITSVAKVLVVESSGIKDDNNSAPVQQIIENIIQNNVHNMNGTHEITTEIMKNGNESPEIQIILTEDVSPADISKVVENKFEVNDDVTITSDPIKTDPETSSLGKSISMDSFIDEGGDTITEVDEMKHTETAQNKETSSSMDLETAAVTIQKVFRTFLFKSRESTFDDTGRGNSIDGDSEKTEVEFPVAPPNKDRRTLGISRMDTVLQTVNEEKSLSLSTDESSLSSAATIIQAHVRGFLTRNRLYSNKTNSSSLVNSDGPSSTSLENDLDQKANKTVLNIHIVPEGEHFMSREESLLTSMELSLDGSPPSSTNLHPLGYDKSEPRKQLKREDAIQSVSPPSNNSGKLSEDVDSVKDMPFIDSEQQKAIEKSKDEPGPDVNIDRDDTPTKSTTIETVIEAYKLEENSSSPELSREGNEDVETAVRRKRSLVKLSSDEGDVVTPFEEKSATDSDVSSRLLHSGEFHDIVLLPTKVSRGDTSVVREFKNVLVYFLIWNNS